jgi:outer membrane receptor for ferrienterochelin and colicins
VKTLLQPAAIALACVALPAAAEALEGRVIDARTRQPIAGAEVTIAGLMGSVKTDADGRFTWRPDPTPPFLIVVILPDGRVGRPIEVRSLDPAAILTVPVQAAVTEEVTVTSGVAPSIDATPGAAMTMLTSRELQQRAPANLMQAVENVPGVNAVSEGQAAVPAVRGLARGRTLILIDGSRVTSERRVGPSATFMDPSVAESVDVARGPGSVAYGSDAFGGVISVRTKRPAYVGTTVTGAGTIGTGIPDRRGEFTLSHGFGSGGVIVSAHARAQEDYDGPDGPVLNSGASDYGVLARAERRAGAGTVAASWQSDFGREIERPRNNSDAIRFYYPFDDSHRFNVSYERPGVPGLGSVRVAGFLGATSQRTDQDRAPTPTRARDIVRADISATDFQFRATAERPTGVARMEFGADINGRAGLEAHDILIQYDLAGSVVSTADNLSIESARRTDTGLFVQGHLPLSRLFNLAGGARADWVVNVNEGGYFGDRTVSNGAMAGFAALTAGPFQHLTLSAQIARGFRDPTLSDRFYRGPTGRGFITGNPDLEPETSLQLDLGARYATSRLRLAGYAYHYDIKHLIERYPVDQDSFAFRNRGEAEIRGVEIEMQADLGGGYSLEAGAQVSRGRAEDDGAALDDISPDTLSLVLRKSFGVRASVYARLANYADDDRPGPSEVWAPGHTNLDVGATWFAHRRLEVRGAVRNLLNQEYYASPDPRFVLAPGVNGFVTIQVKF